MLYILAQMYLSFLIDLLRMDSLHGVNVALVTSLIYEEWISLLLWQTTNKMPQTGKII